MAASSSSSFKSVRSSPFMRPFWSCLESRAKFLKVQSALPRFGSAQWLVYIPPPPPPHFSGRSLGRTAWRIKRTTSAGKAIPLVARRATRNICVMRLRAKTELPSRVTTRINRRPWPKTTAILRCWTLFWQFLSICHLPNHGKRKVAANKLKLGKWKIYWWKILIDR